MWLSKRRTGPQTGLKTSTLASDANLVKESLNMGDFNCRLAGKNVIYEGESKNKGKIHLTALIEVTVSS